MTGSVSVIVLFFVTTPFFVHAVGAEADAMCNPVIPACPCKTIPGPQGGCIGGANMFMCPCFDFTQGFKSVGVCVAPNKCEGKTFEGQAGGQQGIIDPSQLLSTIGQLISALGGGGGGAPPPPPPPSFSPTDFGTGIPQPTFGDNLFDTTGTGGSLDGGTANTLLNALGGTGKQLQDAVKNTNSGNPLEFVAGKQASSTASSTGLQVPKLNPSVVGDIVVSESGATVVAESIDPATNSGTAGFLGAGSGSLLQSKSIAGRLCANRPWANNFLSSIIAPKFFDSICTWAGYQTTLAPAPQTGGTGFPMPSQPRPRPAQPEPEQAFRPEVNIWADPASVRLGTRAYIFWNSRDVSSCEATGPSFSQKTLSGGASTVPLSDVSTFSISCTTPDGKITVEDSVTVYLAI